MNCSCFNDENRVEIVTGAGDCEGVGVGAATGGGVGAVPFELGGLVLPAVVVEDANAGDA